MVVTLDSQRVNNIIYQFFFHQDGYGNKATCLVTSPADGAKALSL